MNRRIKFIAAALMALGICVLSGCSNTPDTVEDPLSAYGIDGVLPFETAKPQVVAPTSTPAPTVNPDELPTDEGYGKQWQNDTTGVNDDDTGDDIDTGVDDDYGYTQPTPRVTAKPVSDEPLYERLQYGDSGDGVKKLQKRLKTLGYYTGSVDGDYGTGTVTAIKTFQGIMGYTQSGIATVAVQEAVFNSNAPRYSATPVPAVKSTPRPTNEPDSSQGYQRLQKGAQGSSVTRLQNRLKTLGYYTGTADGVYGSGTVSAVKRFQSAIGLAQTGVATVAMQTKLFSSSAPYYEEYVDEDDFDEDDYGDEQPVEAQYIKLEKGSTGDRVYELQQRLKDLGYYSGSIDGAYGTSTVNAVKLFQRTLGLSQTGVATVAMQKKLFSTSAAAYEGEAESGGSEYSVLSPGDKGAAVKRMQTRLGELGYYNGTPNGTFDSKTTKAVKLFQNSLGVKETGVATASFQKKLFADNAPFFEEEEPPAADEYIELRKGDSGDAVTRLQSRLTALGYYSGNINGAFNAKTVAAVKLFEKRYSQPQTGVATVKLQKKLYSGDALPYEDEETQPEPDAGKQQYTRLEKGDSGAKVKTLQRRLKELGYFTGSIGGNYQKLTTDAVTRFQLAVGLNPSGVATVATQQALYADDAPYYETNNGPSYDTDYSPLKRGDTGSGVKSLQSRLIELGYIRDASSIKSGTYDAATAYAVAEAQAARGYDSVGDTADTEFLTYIFSDAAWDYALLDYEGG